MKIQLSIILLIQLSVFQLLGQAELINNDSLIETTIGISQRRDHVSHLDSLTKQFLLTAFDERKELNKTIIDSSFLSSKKTIKLNRLLEIEEGNVHTSYAYGLLVGYIDTSSSRPLQSFRTNGDFNVNVATVPVRFAFNYNTLKNPFGVNNYFRASIDMEKYKEKQRLQREKLQGISAKKIEESQKIQQGLVGKLGYAEVLKKRIKDEIDIQRDKIVMDESALSSVESQFKDSMETRLSSADSLKYASASNKADSIRNQLSERKEELDKLLSIYDTLENCYSRLSELNKVQDSVQSFYSTQKSKYSSIKANGVSSVADNFLGNVTKLDIGLTYPKTTALSVNSIPIKGVDFEYQKNNWFTAVSAGITMNNLMVTNDLVQSKLLYSQNMFNLFDFQNIRQKRLLTMIKTGYGTKETTHLFVGVRYTNKAITPGDLQGDSSDVVPSLGLELDCRLKSKHLKGTVFDLVYGKTSSSEMQADSSYLKPLSSLFSSTRTHIGLLKISQVIPQLKTTLIGTFRWIDPHADMASIGVLQPNNVRMELTTKHSISSNFSLGTSIRKDRNNLDNHFDSTLNLNLIGGNFSGRFFDHLEVYGNLNYLSQGVSRISMPIETNSRNYMYSLGANTNYKIGDFKHAVSLNYSDYLISTMTDIGRYRAISFQNLTKLSNGQNNFSINYFKVNSSDSLPSETLIVGDELSYVGEKTQLKLGLKLSYNKEFGDDFGFKVDLTQALTKQLSFKIKIEKFILGNFYSNFDLDRFNRFPFLFMTQLNYSFR